MRTETVHCASCGKALFLAWNPERPDNVIVYCSWRCHARLGNGTK